MNMNTVSINQNDTILNKILFYYLHYARDYLLSCRSGGAQSGINKEIISNTYIIKFCDKEQKRIADYLDKKTQKIDELVQKTEKKIELLFHKLRNSSSPHHSCNNVYQYCFKQKHFSVLSRLQ